MRYVKKHLEFLRKNAARVNGENYTWLDLAKDFNTKFKTNLSRDAIRQKVYTLPDYEMPDTLSPEEIVGQLRTTSNARKARSKLSKENKAILEYLEKQESVLESFKQILEENPIKVHKPVKHNKKKKIKRAIFGKLSDLHIQAQIDEEEMGGLNKFGNIEEARRLAFYMRELGSYKEHHREETELILPLNGDIGQGIIHDIESTPPMTTQFAAMLHLLTQAISYAASKYSKVRLVMVGGNHLRFMHKSNKGRQTSQKWDSFSTLLYIALEYALKDHENIEFETPVTPYALIEVLNHKYFITHGDTVLNVGNPGKNISTEQLKNKVNDLISGLGHIDAVLVGHVHVPCYTTLNNGTDLVINGSLSGIDPFCQSIGLFKNNPCQVMFEATEEYPVGDVRVVRLQCADELEELDKIIQPFEGKF